jgi:hypothetical protein
VRTGTAQQQAASTKYKANGILCTAKKKQAAAADNG